VSRIVLLSSRVVVYDSVTQRYNLMQRLFSLFPNGWPGAGLLLLRLAAGAPLLFNDLSQLSAGPDSALFWIKVVAIVCGGLLIAGLWTPFSGAAQACLDLWLAISDHQDGHLSRAVIGFSLVVLGPGACSIDARLYGRRRIDL
jgi:putative oxidoreductase